MPKLEQLLTSRQVLVVRAEENEALVSADPTGIERVICELVENGRDAMTEEGQLTVGVERAELTEAEARLRPGEDVQPGHYVVLSVSDTGRGMDRPTAARAFEPFFTTKPFGEGIGLGLAMVHGIVKQHGGYVWVTTEPDRGTVVRLYLPAVPSSDAASLSDQTEPA
jgi:two-component system, cell cycle sensor histidine kinase and response regulator CckA